MTTTASTAFQWAKAVSVAIYMGSAAVAAPAPRAVSASNPQRGDATMRPHLFVTAKEIKGLRSVAAVRTAVKTGRAQTIWEELKRAADADAEADVLVPTSIVPGRPA
ncbi:MAG: hypothetical protein HON70_14360, partial [Lentisphaerae bacterium]|nr:hypothetical protein [Lentisphaerota bacterium]